MSKVKVSVIVPCFNVEKYVERGVKCLTRQTLGDIEIICINDASTDSTLQILESLSILDMRIKIIDLKKNSGVSAARNAGIKSAIGEFIGFMDPDDMIDLDFYEKLYNRAKKCDAVMSIGNLKCHNFHPLKKGYKEHVDVDPKWRSISRIEKNLFNFAGHFTTIINRQFALGNNLIYPAGLSNGEDHVFETKCIIAVHGSRMSYTVAKDTYYHHIKRLGSLDTHFFNTKKIKDNLDAIKTNLALINNAPGVSENDYNALIFPRINYLYNGLLSRITDEKSAELIAEALIEIYRNMKYKEEIHKSDPMIFMLLVSENRAGLVKYFFDITRLKVRRYYLFGILNILTVSEKYNLKSYVLFNLIHIWKAMF